MFWTTDEVEALRQPRAGLAKQARDNALVPFAFVKDGQWVERGEMLMFACVANEKDKNTWISEFNKMFDALPPETWLTVVDCHI